MLKLIGTNYSISLKDLLRSQVFLYDFKIQEEVLLEEY